MKNKVESNDWLVRGISKEDFQTEKTLAIIGLKINLKRLELGMDQKEFAKHMGVTQGLVSRWESGTYNFTISKLISICSKLNLEINIDVDLATKCKETMSAAENEQSANSKWKLWNPDDKKFATGGVA